MKTTTEFQLVATDKLIPYVNNARTHSPEQIKKLRSSLREFGFVNPVIIDREYNVIAGHGRIMAAKEEGITEVPCVYVDHLTDAQKKAYGYGLDPNYLHPYMWACKSHYYSGGLSFYNFPYAFGQLFGVGMFAQYRQEGAAFVPKYNKLLRSCGSMMVADVAGSVGIDVRSPDFWRASLKVYEEEIGEFIALADELMK